MDGVFHRRGQRHRAIFLALTLHLEGPPLRGNQQIAKTQPNHLCGSQSTTKSQPQNQRQARLQFVLRIQARHQVVALCLRQAAIDVLVAVGPKGCGEVALAHQRPRVVLGDPPSSRYLAK